MWIESLRIAWSVLNGHRFRSLLTVGSILVGAFSIVLMSSLAASGLGTLMAGLEEIGGARLMAVWSRPPEDERANRMAYVGGLTRQDLDVVRSLPHLRGATLIADMQGKDLTSDTGERRTIDLVGVEPSFFPFFGYRTEAGRALDRTDQEGRSRLCVVAHDTAERLGQDGRPALGRLITVHGLRCQVIGALAKVDRWGVGMGWEWDDAVFVPIEALADTVFKEVQSSRWLLLRTDDPRNNEVLKRTINVLLHERHHGLNDFNLLDFHKNFVEGFLKVFVIMQVIVAALAGIALIVGGIGVMNIMLVSVSERVREIGIRKALGASPGDIGRQFLVEAVLLSGIGGCLGVLLGIVGAVGGGLLIRTLKPRWLVVVSEPAALAALLVALAVGVIFGYVPARRAARLDAVTAIRSGS